jgi:hypothetical protein
MAGIGTETDRPQIAKDSLGLTSRARDGRHDFACSGIVQPRTGRECDAWK